MTGNSMKKGKSKKNTIRQQAETPMQVIRMLRAQTEQMEDREAAKEKDKGIRELTGTIRTMEGEGKAL